jgi:hypothetical protein
MAAAAGRLLWALVPRQVSTISRGISASATLRPVSSRRTCFTNVCDLALLKQNSPLAPVPLATLLLSPACSTVRAQLLSMESSKS